MVRAAELPSESHGSLSIQSGLPLLIAFSYLALLITPWALTCAVAWNPDILAQRTMNARDPTNDFYVSYSAVQAIEVLDAMAAVVSLPVLSSLLARAAVVFSQRRRGGGTGSHRKLTVRQLFALADRGWWNLFLVLKKSTSSLLLVLGWLLLLVAFVLPLVYVLPSMLKIKWELFYLFRTSGLPQVEGEISALEF